VKTAGKNELGPVWVLAGTRIFFVPNYPDFCVGNDPGRGSPRIKVIGGRLFGENPVFVFAMGKSGCLPGKTTGPLV